MRVTQWMATATLVTLLGVLLTGLMAVGVGPRTDAMLRGIDRYMLVQERIRVTPPIRAAAAPVAHSGLPQGLVLGYFYDSPDDPAAVSFLTPYVHEISGIIPFWYTIEADGALEGSSNGAVMAWARAHHLYTFALVTNMAGAPVFSPLLASRAAQARAIQAMLEMVERNGYNGVNLDWEGIAPGDRNAYTRFVEDLTQVFHRQGYYVTLSVPAETENDPADGWTGAYNYAALGRAADLLMLMAYDEHNADSGPGPVAATAWVTAVLKYAVSVVPPSKIILGIPGYGYDWSSAGTEALSWYQANALAQEYGKNSGSGHFVYVSGGVLHTVYFENAATFLQKMQLITGLEIRGLALWRLGIEDPKIWGYLH